MYESPITIKTEEIARNIMDKQEEYILTQVQMCVDVDKDELIKALEYDRGQYEKGYADGRASATKHGHWAEHKDYPGLAYLCSKCNHFTTDRSYYCPMCGAKMDEDMVDAVNEAPTVDAVEVVRCKDCRYATTSNYRKGLFCGRFAYDHEPTVEPYDYCSRGESKTTD